MKTKEIEQIFTIFSQHNPNPTTELQFINDFTFLIAIILSARSTDKHVNKCTAILFSDVQSPQQILKLGEEELSEYIKTIGLWRNKGKNIVKMSEILVAKHDGRVPKDFDQLIELPGVGRKSANVFLNNFYGKIHIGVDTHVSRVSQRLNLTQNTDPTKIEADLLKIIPKKWQRHAHNWLVLHGRYVCKAAKPQCSECKINQFCTFFHKGVAN